MRNFTMISPLIILIFTSGCQMNNSEVNLHKEFDSAIEAISLKTDLLENKDYCRHINNEDDIAFSCYYLKFNNGTTFQTILSNLTDIGFKPASAIRQDYGAWSVILKGRNTKIILRSESIENAKSGEYAKMKAQGKKTRLDIMMRHLNSK